MQCLNCLFYISKFVTFWFFMFLFSDAGKTSRLSSAAVNTEQFPFYDKTKARGSDAFSRALELYTVFFRNRIHPFGGGCFRLSRDPRYGKA